MESERMTRISEFLTHNGASIDTISKSRLAQFEKVDTTIQERLTEIVKAQELLRGNPINVSTIATDTGIARKTFYNNELLRLYIEEHSSVCEDKTVSGADVERLKARCGEAERRVRQFLLRDIETENLRHENMRLQAEIQNLETRNHSLEEQCELLQKELSEMTKNIPVGKGTVLPFKLDTNQS